MRWKANNHTPICDLPQCSAVLDTFFSLVARKKQHWDLAFWSTNTLWHYRHRHKNVFKEIHERPMCWKICATLGNDPPEKSVAMHRRKLPAAVLVPGIMGWLCQVNSLRQLGFVHSALMTTSVPFSVAVTLGLFSVRQKWQSWNNNRSLDKNTMCFGSALKL